MSIAIILRTFLRGRLVGVDDQGNKYYEDKRKKRYGKPRRWVIYKGPAEASRVPADWYGWLHFTTDESMSTKPSYPWEMPHQPNLTGTPNAHKPKGLKGQPVRETYTAWKPR